MVAACPVAARTAATPRPTVTAALRRFVPALRAAHPLAPHVDRVLHRLCACQTEALGGHRVRCACGWSEIRCNACGNRHCPQCRGAARAAWVRAREAQLLAVPHFQVVFTLPAPLRVLTQLNPTVVLPALFHAARDTLQLLAAQRLRAQLGLVGVLHTWSSTLAYHPHVHCLVTAGGLHTGVDALGAPDDTWVPSRPAYLFPTRVMAALFRGKMCARLRAAFADGALRLPDDGQPEVVFERLLADACRHRWVVHVEPPDGRPVAQVAKYLARYVAGLAIADHRMRDITDDTVSFVARGATVTLSGVEFARRFATHVLPPRVHRCRYYGLYAASNAHDRWDRARHVLEADGIGHPPDPPPRPARTCPECGGPLTVVPVPGMRFWRPALRLPALARGPP